MRTVEFNPDTGLPHSRGIVHWSSKPNAQLLERVVIILDGSRSFGQSFPWRIFVPRHRGKAHLFAELGQQERERVAAGARDVVRLE
jgi:hypothetical protein